MTRSKAWIDRPTLDNVAGVTAETEIRPIPEPSKPSPSLRPKRFIRALKVLGAIAWPFLMLFVLLATAVLFWMSLAVVILRSPPQGKALVVLRCSPHLPEGCTG